MINASELFVLVSSLSKHVLMFAKSVSSDLVILQGWQTEFGPGNKENFVTIIRATEIFVISVLVFEIGINNLVLNLLRYSYR